MGEQGRWFKLWTTAPDDPHLGNLSLEDFARWCLLGVYLKVHGTDGTVTVIAPAVAFVRALRLDTFEHAIAFVRGMPNCTVTLVTTPPVTGTVTWANWLKYQGDYSGDRVRRFRDKQRRDVTPKKRRDETRRDETKTPSSTSPPAPHEPDLPVPPSILAALDRAPHLGAVPRLRSITFWRASIRATNGHVKYAEEVLKAEAWLTANPTRAPRKDLARFLHNWLARADQRP